MLSFVYSPLMRKSCLPPKAATIPSPWDAPTLRSPPSGSVCLLSLHLYGVLVAGCVEHPSKSSRVEAPAASGVSA